MKKFDKAIRVISAIALTLHFFMMCLTTAFHLYLVETAVWCYKVIDALIKLYDAIDWQVVLITTAVMVTAGVIACIAYFMHQADCDLKDYRGDKSTWK